MVGPYTFKEVIAAGTWADGGRWEIVPFAELPPKLADPKFCTAVGVVALYDPPDAPEMPRTVMTLKKEEQGGRGIWETPSGKNEPLHPDNPDGPRETLEATARRESLEEGGIELEDRLLPFACRISYNPPGSRFPGLSYMLYLWGVVRGGIGIPAEVGYEGAPMGLEELGERARQTAAGTLALGESGIALEDVRLIQAAFIDAGYPAKQVNAALGELPPRIQP